MPNDQPLEMNRSVSQLLFSYLPNRTVNWEDGAGIVQLDTPRLESAWPTSQSEFVLREVGEYLQRWSSRGTVDSRFPPTGRASRYTIGTPRSITSHALETAFYCRNCYRFVTRLASGPNKFNCPDCRRPTLRQLGYVFVHGCGELTPIREAIPIESPNNPGTIYWAPIRCRTCGDRAVLRLDARSERLSALRVFCETCRTDVLGRPLARCPYCLPRMAGAVGATGQLAFKTAMRITRHSANNAYYPHAITILRLDRPRVVQAGPEMGWLQSMLPDDERTTRVGVSSTLATLVDRLLQAEQAGREDVAADLRVQIATAATAPASAPTVSAPPVSLPDDIVQNVRESVALLSTVRRTDVRRLQLGSDQGRGRNLDAVNASMATLGIRQIELAEDLPVISAVFGYTRRSPDPDYQEAGAAERFRTTLRPFPSLDDAAARALSRPQAAGTTPILAREGSHEGLALYLDPGAVLRWVEHLGFQFGGNTEQERTSDMLSRLEPAERYYDDIWELPLRRIVFGLLHSVSHSAMRALSRTAGLEETSVSEYLFLPLLCTVVYSTASSHLGGVRTTARDRLLEFLETIDEEATRCLYDPDCIERSGACHGCIHVPELGCRVFNHGLSRALLVGGHAPWASAADRTRITGFWQFLSSPGSAV